MHAKILSPAAPLDLPRNTHAENELSSAAWQQLTAALAKPFVALLLLLAAVLAAYAPTLGGAFLWDDNTLVKSNLLIRSPLFGGEVFRHLLFDDASNFYRPVQTLTFIADYWFWGMNPFGYHLTSILLHACNCWLLYLVLRQMLPSLLPAKVGNPARISLMCIPSTVAFAISLVWGLHPVHSAAVAYISGSADLLAMGFCLCAWLFCENALRAARPWPRFGWAAGAFVSLLLGLCSKEIASIWLALFVMYLFGVRRDLPLRSRLLALSAGLAALAIYAGLRHLPTPPPPHPPYPALPSRWLLMIRALGDYGSLLLFPARLFMERQVFAAPGLANPENDLVYLSMGIAGGFMLILFVGGAWSPGRGQTLRRFGAGWFLLAFLPISNLFTLNASVAEHWLYLPSIGFLLFLAGVIAEIPWRRMPRAAAATVAAVALVAGALGVRTYVRGFDWLSELAFFQQTIKDGGDVPRARLGLANSYSHLQDNASAIPMLRQMAAKYPRMLLAKINLATTLSHQGQTDEARQLFYKILEDPELKDDPRPLMSAVANLDQLSQDPDWPRRRRALLAGGMRLHPNSWELVMLQMQEYEHARDFDKALTLTSRFLDSHWWHAPARFASGSLHLQTGRDDQALADFSRAAELDVRDTTALNAAAEVYLREQRFAEARDCLRRAVRRQPDSPRQRLLLAQALERQGDKTEAAEQTAAARQMLEQAAASTP